MGRGSSGATSKEDREQRNYAKTEGFRKGAKYYEYTDMSGRVFQGETGNEKARGGTYRASYSTIVSDYSKKSTSELNVEKERLKAISDENYQKFARSAASKSASQVSAFADADARISAINQVLKRRKRR